MKIKTFKEGSDGKVRPIEDRPIKAGQTYLAKLMEHDEPEEYRCIDIPPFGLFLINPKFPNFKVATNYYFEIFI